MENILLRGGQEKRLRTKFFEKHSPKRDNINLDLIAYQTPTTNAKAFGHVKFTLPSLYAKTTNKFSPIVSQEFEQPFE